MGLMEVRQLEHFIAVAEEHSFTRAAQRLSYVQSALSVSIQSLERDLGLRLFDRDTHRVALTDAGEALLPSVRRTLASVEQTRDVAAALKGVVRGTMRIGLMQSFGFLDVPALLGHFHRLHPDVEIEIRPSPGGSAVLVEELRRATLDIAFVAVTGDPPGLRTTELGVEELHLVGAEGLLPPHAAPIELSELSDATFVDFPTGWGVRTVVDQALAAAGVSRRVTIEVADVSTYVQLLEAGLGVALTPRSVLPREHRLLMRRLASPVTWRVVMALPSDRPVRAAADAFAELVLGPARSGLRAAGFRRKNQRLGRLGCIDMASSRMLIGCPSSKLYIRPYFGLSLSRILGTASSTACCRSLVHEPTSPPIIAPGPGPEAPREGFSPFTICLPYR
jgi:DNA-binding transcriptional LysR family regulator